MGPCVRRDDNCLLIPRIEIFTRAAGGCCCVVGARAVRPAAPAREAFAAAIAFETGSAIYLWLRSGDEGGQAIDAAGIGNHRLRLGLRLILRLRTMLAFAMMLARLLVALVGLAVAALFTLIVVVADVGLRLLRNKARLLREREARRASKILGVTRLLFCRLPDWFVGENVIQAAKRLVPILKRAKPDLIYFPYIQEWHPDHKAAWPIVRAALKAARIPRPELRAYEVWTPLSEYDHVEDISRMMTRKLRALRAHRSQLKHFDYRRAVIGLDQFRGALAGRCRYAEVFQTISLKVKK